MTRRMTARLHTTAIKTREAVQQRLAAADNDRGAGAVEYVLLAVFGTVIIGLIVVAVTAFVNGELGRL